ncbi:hypothetical protein BN7_3785 [Wickerhamomyces ciferrii]|uniref:Domain of unknown function at the cortex 1 domain-containing protein n=1 Tax=Wickerhamomyces ciferrii (strain ATCC 14091 / BCRC 22168 / CBS 111 / JCM 3599 / NBRC 0793 / NRRL Y-1031 F-60-10) TaxID=1206466 RepID=K0KMP4_WICCF|nr:uncharacterized protein BN7_3785 [Wickerhamomyces ciferrii]CCH44226.1 hypothetical protein BN7_3785 [Wickerhamomyces ciferrii]
MSWWNNSNSKTKALKITASSQYEDPNPQIVPVNSESPITINSPSGKIQLYLRIKDFKGSIDHDVISSKDSPYFKFNQDANISIQLSFTPNQDISGDGLLFGNDFSYPIKDYLPYGTSTGLNLFKKYVDPSVDGDLYLEKPYLYGKALSSFNVINDKVPDKDSPNVFIEENLVNDEFTTRKLIIPVESSDRQKIFHQVKNQEDFIFEKDHTYNFDFFSGLLSLKNSQFNIKLPGGFEINLSNYLNENFNSVRYVLKKGTSGELGTEFGEPLLVINFELVPTPDEKDDEDSKTDEKETVKTDNTDPRESETLIQATSQSLDSVD